MKRVLLAGLFLWFGPTAFASTCLPGTLSDYINLGATGCSLNAVQFSNFNLAPGQSFAVPIDPDTVQVTPAGGLSTPTLSLALNTSAAAGELFELFVGFNASGGAMTAASIALGSPTVTGDGAVTGILDVCADGFFLGLAPIGCSGTPATAIAFAIASDSLPSSSVKFPATGFFDIFADVTVDGGLAGTATLASANVSVTTPEPAPVLLVTAALGLLGIVKLRRRKQF